jgi:hypothetical protein
VTSFDNRFPNDDVIRMSIRGIAVAVVVEDELDDESA